MEHNQVEVTSIETIIPSKATPPHLKTYNFCLLDQLFPLIYVPQVFFYKNNLNQDTITSLKDSLSKSLSLFYPLAGRLTEDESSINCNDKGIPFIAAQAKGTLMSFIEAHNRINSLIRQFIPRNIYDDNDSDRSSSQRSKLTRELLVPLVVQVTTFECGGIAIGYQKLHKIVDGGSWGSFLETWAAFTRGGGEEVMVTQPDFTAAIDLFPPCSWAVPAQGVKPIILDPFEIKEDNNGCIVKAFAFGQRDIAALQAMAKSESVPNPTRVEAVSGFIWKHAMVATSNYKMLGDFVTIKGAGSSVLIHTVNMRPCVRPPLPPTTVGNLIAHAIAYSDKPITELELKDLVREIRRGISDAKDDKFLKNFQGERGGNFVREHMKKMMGIYENTSMNTYKFTSWSRNGLGLNSDFGFGLPLWIGYIGGRVNSLLRNFIPLIGTIDNGIEAWLVLDEKDMDRLESDSQFLAFASPIN